MAIILFSKTEVAQLVENLIECGALRVAARSRDGEPLLDPADVRRAFDEFALAARIAKRRRGSRKAQGE